MRLLWFAVLAWAAASGAQAATYACSEHAEGADGARVTVYYRLSDREPATMKASWYPPRPNREDVPFLDLGYDLSEAGLGRLREVRAAVLAGMKPPPKSSRAEVVLELDGREWQRPWGMFPELKARETGSVAIWGSVPLAVDADEGRDVNLELLDDIAAAKGPRLTVRGDADETFGAATVDLSATAERDRLLQQAWAKTAEAAKTPKRCKKVPD